MKQLQDELEKQQVHLREADREKTRAVQELSEQNQRLLDQLSKVSGRKTGRRKVGGCFRGASPELSMAPFGLPMPSPRRLLLLRQAVPWGG